MKKFLITAFLICFFTNIYSQKFTISGFLEDKVTGEKLIGANVFDAETYSGTISNSYGFYSLTLKKNKYKIIFSFVGYQKEILEIDLKNDTVITVSLSPSLELEGVTIRGESVKNIVENSQMSSINIPVKTIKSLPVLLGEIDIIKTIQLLPGVQSGTEGTSGFYVRGGGPDQNLILLDGVPVYNANHLFGFFSVFNADAINTVDLIKGGFPARYGGRLSSVLDIRMKEGNKEKIHGQGNIGLVSSKLSIDGPINDKTTFIVSARRTYIDILAQPFIRLEARDLDKFYAGYYFYDLNAKINYEFSDKSRLYLSSYMGNDRAYFNSKDSYNSDYEENKFKLQWGNITTALRWNYILNKKLFSNTTLTYSRYKFLTGIQTEEEYDNSLEKFKFDYTSGINDLAAKIDFDFMPNPNQYIKFGVNNIYHTFNPGVNAFKYSDDSDVDIDTTFGNNKIYANEFSAYFEDDIKFNALLRANIGLHYSGFLVKGIYYNSLQPRISLRYMINEKLSVKAAYTHMTQYIHLLSNTSIGLPTDLWLPVTDTIKPQKSVQYALGCFYNLNDKYNISVEAFYKTMQNLIEYKEGASFISQNDSWQNKVELGKGWSYGLEFLIKKDLGKTTGWIGYTLSWAERQFENISFGKKFPYKYDRRHDISIVVTHKFNKKIDVGLTWVYGTGNAITLAKEKYLPYNEKTIYNYYQDIQYIGKRNNFRMPAYHRLDVGVNFHKQKKWGQRTWSIGLYNAYNRQNPFFVYFSTEYYDTIVNNGKKVLKQVSLFPIIPSISYSFKF